MPNYSDNLKDYNCLNFNYLNRIDVNCIKKDICQNLAYGDLI